MAVTGVDRPTAAIIWELRSAWATRTTVRLSLTDRCLIPRVIGQVTRVAVTGAFVEVDGWQIPADEILAIGKPTVAETDEYRETRVGPEHFDLIRES